MSSATSATAAIPTESLPSGSVTSNRYLGTPVASSQTSRCDNTCMIVLPVVIVACIGIILLLLLWRMKRKSAANDSSNSSSNPGRTFSYDEKFRRFIIRCRRSSRQKKGARRDLELGYPTNAKKNGVAIGADDIGSIMSNNGGGELRSMKSMSGATLRGVESTSSPSSQQGSQVQLATANVVGDVWKERRLGMEM